MGKLKRLIKKVIIKAKRRYTLDIENFLTHSSKQIKKLIKKSLIEYKNLKFQIAIKCKLRKYNSSSNEYNFISPFFTSEVITIFNKHGLKSKLKAINSYILNLFHQFIEGGSGWTLLKCKKIHINLYKYSPLSGGNKSAPILPLELRRKKSIISLKAPTNECFLYAAACVLYNNSKQNCIKKKNRHRCKKYKEITKKFNLEGISLPVSIRSISRFEILNNQRINVFIYHQKQPSCIYVSDRVSDKACINLLLYKNHYYPIMNLDGFLRTYSYKTTAKIYHCLHCFSRHYSQQSLDEHSMLCLKNKQKLLLPKDQTLQFRNFTNQTFVNFVIYCDLETINCPTSKPPTAKREYLAELQPLAFGIKRVCLINESFDSNVIVKTSKNGCISEFIAEIIQQKVEIDCILNEVNFPMHSSKNTWQELQTATHCYICNKRFEKKDKKCRDHLHLKPTENFIGIAHNSCNLNRSQINKKVILAFHNLSSFDGHFLIRELCKNFKVKIIPKSYEKYLCIAFDNMLIIDTLAFLNSSLDELVQNLKTSGNFEMNFKHTLKLFPTCNYSLDCLLQKGVFPYDYINHYRRLSEKELPGRKCFYNSIKKTHITEKEYSHAQNMFQLLNCKSIKDYLLHYLALDVTLLADVFQSFRILGHKLYNLDPANYMSLPGYSFDSMLLYSNVKIQLLPDIDMFLFLNNSLKGGVSGIIGERIAKANHKQMLNYNKNNPESHIYVFDCNSLYPYCMRSKLPHSNFRFLSENSIKKLDFTKISKNSTTGYILQLDLDYPQHLHNRRPHVNMPLAPEKRCIPKDMLSPYSKQLLNKLCLHRSDKIKKLILTLGHKKNYVVHYRTLQLYLKLGLKIKKITKVLAFEQRAWMKDFIDFNSNKRKKAKTNFESNLYKISSNSLYGKTLQNCLRYRNIQLVSEEKKLKKLINLHNFKSSRLLDENLAAVELNATKCIVKSPIFVGFTCLELAKRHLYKFIYNFLEKKFSPDFDINFHYTDTDSVIIQITQKHINGLSIDEKMTELKQLLDTSNFPKNHPAYSKQNEKKTGFFKSEYTLPIESYIGLSSKKYSLQFTDQSLLNKNKGVPKVTMKDFTHDDYFNALTTKKSNNGKKEAKFVHLLSLNHQMFQCESTKSCLSSFCDKRYYLNSIDSLPFFHKQL